MCFDSVAQLGEHHLDRVGVAGSSPVRVTIIIILICNEGGRTMVAIALRVIIYVLLVFVIIYIIRSLFTSNTPSMREHQLQQEATKSFDMITYAGGTTTIKEINVEGTLHISQELIVFDDGNKNLFTIIIRNITNSSVVKIEEDGKNKSYIRIEYRNEDGAPRSVMLHSNFNEEYAQRIAVEINKRIAV